MPKCKPALLIGVDKIIRIVLPSIGPISPYIHEYLANTILKERIPEVLRHLQVIHDDRRSQKPNILHIHFHNLPYFLSILLLTPSLFYNLQVSSMTCSSTFFNSADRSSALSMGMDFLMSEQSI